MKKFLIILLGLLLLVVLFYWFQYRPTEIRGYCDWKTKSEVGWNVSTYSDSRWTKYENIYNSCLHEKGLK